MTDRQPTSAEPDSFDDTPIIDGYGGDDKMERRKIQLSGRTTFVVSLPKSWVQAANLEAGDTVGIDVQDDGTLVVVPDRVRKRRSPQINIDATGMQNETLLRELMAAYLGGYDLMTVTARAGVTPEQRIAVKRMTEMTVGFEVVEESPRQIVLQDMVDPTQFASRGGLQRLSRITVGMINDALEALETRDEDLARDVIARDDSVDRMYLMIAKQHVHLLSDISMARRKQVTLKESLFLAQAARSLERCGDHATRLGYTFLEAMKADTTFPPALWKTIRTLAGHSVAILQKAVESFMRADREAAHEVLAASDKLTAERGALTRQLLAAGEEELLILGLVVESLERIHQYAADIAEAALAYAAIKRDAVKPKGVRKTA